jgi:hypothetical protein
MSQSWRHITKFDKVDMCSLTRPSKSRFGVGAIVASAIRDSGANFECPVKNGTVIKLSNYTDSEESAGFLSVPPGNYRTSLLFYNNNDEKMLLLRLYFFVKANATQKEKEFSMESSCHSWLSSEVSFLVFLSAILDHIIRHSL